MQTGMCGQGEAQGGEPIFTEADSVATLYDMVRDAVRCHFEEGQRPRIIRLHFVRDEFITA
jgi:hypothetical protein